MKNKVHNPLFSCPNEKRSVSPFGCSFVDSTGTEVLVNSLCVCRARSPIRCCDNLDGVYKLLRANLAALEYKGMCKPVNSSKFHVWGRFCFRRS